MKTWEEIDDELNKPFNQLLEAVKLAYRKHHLDDDSIGWDELSETLQNALCNVMGDDKFTGWLSQIREMWYQRE